MKRIIIIVLVLVSIISCGMEVIPDREYMSKKDCLKDVIDERGEWDDQKELDSYTDGEERKVKIIWDIDESTTDDNGTVQYFDEYYYIIWNNTDIRNYDWDYGWNILDGPHRSN